MENLLDKIYRCFFNFRNEQGCRWEKNVFIFKING